MREAARRLERYGPNELRSARAVVWRRELVRQFTHPLALLLLCAAGLAFVAGTVHLGWAILAVVVLNAGFAFVQERQAGKAVEALSRYLPPSARVRRGGAVRLVAAAAIVPGDVLLLAEGDRVPADARLLSGALEIDASALTGESEPVRRLADAVDTSPRVLDSPVLVFSRHGVPGRSGRGGGARDRRAHRDRPDRPRWPGGGRRATARWSVRCGGWPT